MRTSVLCFGEILFDVFPAYRRLGGAPLNFACHMQALGQPCMLISRVGDDPEGREILHSVEGRIGTRGIQVDPLHPTGRVQVRLDDRGVPEFEILKDAAYDYIAPAEGVPAEAGLFYFGTLAQRHPVSRRTLERLLSAKGGAAVLYDMNLRPPHYTPEIVEHSLHRCDILKLNEEELRTCMSLFPGPADEESYLSSLMDRFRVTWCSLTRGSRGSELFYGRNRYTAGPAPQQTVIDTVGAGDAYAAVLALGILHRWDPETILPRAAAFSAALCAIPGAVPDDPAFYAPYRSWSEEGGHAV